jgi:hypothetical protein
MPNVEHPHAESETRSALSTAQRKAVVESTPHSTLKRDLLRAVLMLSALVALWAIAWDRFQ